MIEKAKKQQKVVLGGWAEVWQPQLIRCVTAFSCSHGGTTHIRTLSGAFTVAGLAAPCHGRRQAPSDSLAQPESQPIPSHPMILSVHCSNFLFFLAPHHCPGTANSKLSISNIQNSKYQKIKVFQILSHYQRKYSLCLHGVLPCYNVTIKWPWEEVLILVHTTAMGIYRKERYSRKGY